jgi:hypothetical protein
MTAHYVLYEVRSTAVYCNKLWTVEVYLSVFLIAVVGGVSSQLETPTVSIHAQTIPVAQYSACEGTRLYGGRYTRLSQHLLHFAPP